jgi:hypothetical protein
MLVKRYLPCGVRTGLVLAFDLDRYDYRPGSASLIRATEGTVEERVKARLSLRRRALIELPHILMLIDDPDRTVIEPLAGVQKTREYDFELMGKGGRITGDFIAEPELNGARAPCPPWQASRTTASASRCFCTPWATATIRSPRPRPFGKKSSRP